MPKKIELGPSRSSYKHSASPQEQMLKVHADALNIKRIQETSGLIFRDHADIERYVEGPLREACRIFLDKNIRTTTSSANIEDGRTEAYIALDASTLSATNRSIAKETGGIFSSSEHGGDAITFTMSIGQSTRIADITNYFNNIANGFELQFPQWIPRMTKEHILASFSIPLERIDDTLEAAILGGYTLGKDGFYYEDPRDEERIRVALGA